MYQNGGMLTSIPMPVLQQTGEVFVGPGANKEANLVGLGLAKLSSRRKDDLSSAKRYAMDVSIKQIMLRQQKQQQENQQKQAMYAQALSLMSRVYVGSISFEIREDMLRKTFEAFGPIKSLNMGYDNVTGHHKGFAFLEYEVPEAALLAQETMNGQLMGGRNLKVTELEELTKLKQTAAVGRPSNMPQAQPIIEMVMAEARKYYRVYVASVHPDLSESDLKTVFEAFGVVQKCQLARALGASRGAHRGFGYIEFDNGKSMMEAIAGMNMFDLGGQYLRVGRCVTPPEALTYLTGASSGAIPAAAAVAAAAVTAKVIAAEASSGPGKKDSKEGSGASTPRGQSPMPSNVKKEKSGVTSDLISPGGSPSSKGSARSKEGGGASPAVAAKLEDMKLEAQNSSVSGTTTPLAAANGSPAIKDEPIPDWPESFSPLGTPPPPPSLATVSKIADASRASFTNHPIPPPGPVLSTPVPPPPPPPTQQASPAQPTGRRRGFGGFATEVPPISTLPAPGVIPPPGILPPPGVVAPPGVVQPPGIYIPPGTSSNASAIPPTLKQEPIEEKEGTIESIEDDPEAMKYFQKLTSAEMKKLKRQRKRENQSSFQDRMSAILSAQHYEQKVQTQLPAEFGVADPLTAPRDPSAEDPLGAGSMLMITGGDRVDRDNASMALSLIDTQGALMMRDEAKRKAKQDALANPKDVKQYKKPNSGFRVPKKKQPKLKTANALKAVQAMGELKDQLMAEATNSEDATLASQEKGLEIRGNDARHLLMTKLMRTNRSTVLVLRNMVIPSEIDEYLEEEVKEECAKFGEVEEVVIANDPAAGIVKIFVRFTEAHQVDAAKAVMDGRFFAGRTVKAEPYDFALFEHGDYTG